jgi:uncharacterized membrane protein
MLACDVDAQIESAATFGEKLADRPTDLVGSWLFLILFVIVTVVSVTVKSFVLLKPSTPIPIFS